MQPLDDRVVVKSEDAETVTKGGIILPDGSESKPIRGKVVATGPGRMLPDGTRGEMQVKEGDLIIFSMYGGKKVEMGGVVYLVMKEADVLMAETPGD